MNKFNVVGLVKVVVDNKLNSSVGADMLCSLIGFTTVDYMCDELLLASKDYRGSAIGDMADSMWWAMCKRHGQNLAA